MRRTLWKAAVVAASLMTPAMSFAESPGLGIAVAVNEIPAWSKAVFPDGQGLPPGSGTVQQGAILFAEKCAACHGAEGEGPVKRLSGGIGTLGSPQPVKSVGSHWPYATTLFGYIRNAMPANAPKSLTNDETYALVAYVLSLSGIVEPGVTIDQQTLPAIKMPAQALLVDHWSAKGELPY